MARLAEALPRARNMSTVRVRAAAEAVWRVVARLAEALPRASNMPTVRVRAAAEAVRRVAAHEPGNNSRSNPSSGNGQTDTAGSSSGNIFGQNPAGGNQTFGGGAIVGVASLSKDSTIRIYNKKATYNEWKFIYDPTSDRRDVAGPYQPPVLGGAQVGIPAGQMNGQQQSPFGQQPASPPQQNGTGMQGPGSQFPPNQNQPKP